MIIDLESTILTQKQNREKIIMFSCLKSRKMNLRLIDSIILTKVACQMLSILQNVFLDI